ncbi:hypothetical protein NMY22_g17398 [Coprinellus aureogranulatus]|nr:hypothetical protein NMY22_g17398 [Coprinellus aureogranulatus]
MSSDSTTGAGSYRLEPLTANNWMPWKQRMLAVLQELELKSYITAEGSVKPVVKLDATPPVTTADVTKWEKGKLKARTRLELAISDGEMAHIIGADMAFQIWERLC